MIYRLISEKELISILKNKKISLSQNDYPPYDENSVIFLFDHNDPEFLLDKYNCVFNELIINESFYVVEINGDVNVENDLSQNGWPESRITKSPISEDQLNLVGWGYITKPHPCIIQIQKYILDEVYDPLVILLINQSLERFTKNDIDLLKISIHEECLNHRLAVYIEQILSECQIDKFYVDIEYNRNIDMIKSINHDNIRIDIIVHGRGNNQNNLLAFEKKKKQPRF
ncbi:MAG: hypothetical protein IPP06_05485 [Saprospiraceae bacterium]|nr:hypothetical protein [Candidatus Vicinibacter affinis]